MSNIEKKKIIIRPVFTNMLHHEHHEHHKRDLKCHLTMKDFQLDVLNWMDQKSGVLALQMGLGKTIISIKHVIDKNLYPSLVIVPPTLIAQWTSEISKHTNAKFDVYKSKKDNYSGIDFIVMSNAKLSDIKDRSLPLVRLITKVKSVFVDEAHTFKDLKTQKFDYLTTLISMNMGIKVWALTGTPIINSSKDLISLKNITRNGQNDDFHENNFYQMDNNLPINLFIHNYIVQMDDDHYKEYKSIINKTSTIFKDKDDVYTIAHINRLRQCSIHPDISIKADQDLIPQNEHNIIKKVLDIIENISNDDKILVFTEWTRLSEYISFFLNKKSISNTIYKDRKSLTDFGKSKVLILNIKSGSVGLNLQSANHCIFTSHSWNDANIQQSIARVKRMGQTKDVHIYNVYSHDSIQMWNNNMIKSKYDIAQAFKEDKRLGLEGVMGLKAFEYDKKLIKSFTNEELYEKNIKQIKWILPYQQENNYNVLSKCKSCEKEIYDDIVFFNKDNDMLHLNCL